MKRGLSILGAGLALFVGNQANAQLSCGFTEPFITINFDPKTKIITRITPESYVDGVEVPTVISTKGALVYVKSVVADASTGVRAGVYELRAGKKSILSLVLNMKGSDGMSGFIYPYDAKMPHSSGVNGVLMGGCDSIELKKSCPQDGGC